MKPPRPARGRSPANPIRGGAQAIRLALADPSLPRFLIAGGGMALFYFGLVYGALRIGFSPMAATLAAYGAAFCVNYFLHSRWTFQRRRADRVALPRYVALHAGLAAFAGLTTEAAALVSAAPLAVATASTVLVAGISYLLSLFWVFGHGGEKPQ